MYPDQYSFISVDGETEIVSLGEAKKQLRVTHGLADDYIQSLISVAREAVEDFTKRSLVEKTIAVGFSHSRISESCGWINGYPVFMQLARPPILTVDSVKYRSFDGTEVTLDSSAYFLDAMELRGMVVIKKSTSLALLDQNYPTPLKVQFKVGKETSELYKHAIKLIVSNLFENRCPIVAGTMNEVPMSVRNLLATKRIFNSL